MNGQIHFVYISRRFVSFYYELRAQKMDFPDTEDENPSKKKAEVSTNPDVASSQQEADDLAKGKV